MSSSKADIPNDPPAPAPETAADAPESRFAIPAIIAVHLILPLLLLWGAAVAWLLLTTQPETAQRIGATAIVAIGTTDSFPAVSELPADTVLITLESNDIYIPIADSALLNNASEGAVTHVRLGDVVRLEDYEGRQSYQAAIFDPRLNFGNLPIPPAPSTKASGLLISDANAGEIEVSVPSLLGLPQDQALATLEKVGLKVEVQPVSFGKGFPGMVVDQKPGAGQMVPAGTVITILVFVEEKPLEQTQQPLNQSPEQTQLPAANSPPEQTQLPAANSPPEQTQAPPVTKEAPPKPTTPPVARTSDNIIGSAATVAFLRADSASAIVFDLLSVEPAAEILGRQPGEKPIGQVLIERFEQIYVDRLPLRQVYILSGEALGDLPIYDSTATAAGRVALAIVATSLPSPQQDKLLAPQAMPANVDAGTPVDKLINGAYLLQPRWTLVPAVLFLAILIVVLAHTLRKRPGGAGRPTARGFLAGLACAAILGLLLIAVRHLSAAVAAAAQPTSPDILVVGIAFVVVNLAFAIGAAAGSFLQRKAVLAGGMRKAAQTTRALPQDNVLRTILYSDKPIDDLTQDRLGFGPLVVALQQFLDNRDTKPPVVIAVNGPWGSGKSSLMKMVAGRLRMTGRFHVAWFNAWEYHTEEQILAAFLKTVASGLIKDWGPWFAIRIAWYRFKRATLLQYLLMASPFALLLMAVFAPNALAPLQSLLAIFTSEKVEAATGVASVAGLGGVAWLIQFLLPFRLQFKKLSTISDPSERVGFIDEFRSEFELYRQAMGKDQKFLIVVDDLDRCLDKNIVEVLKTINLIVAGGDEASRTFFMLGYDPNHVIPSIELHFKDLLAAGGVTERFGESFMKKMVTLSVSVPRPRPDQVERMAVGLDPVPVHAVPSAAKSAKEWMLTGLQRFGAMVQGMGVWVPKLLAALLLLAALAALLPFLVAPEQPKEGAPAATATQAVPTPATPATPEPLNASTESIKITDQVALDQGSVGVNWLTWVTGALVILFATFMVLRQVLRPQPEVELRREPRDTEEFKRAVEACAPLMPANPRDIVRLVNLMRVTFLVQSTRNKGADGYGGTALDPQECVALTVLQQRHRETLNVASLEAAAAAKPTPAQDQAAEAMRQTLAEDRALLMAKGVTTEFLRDRDKMRRFYEVNYFELDPAQALQPPLPAAAQ